MDAPVVPQMPPKKSAHKDTIELSLDNIIMKNITDNDQKLHTKEDIVREIQKLTGSKAPVRKIEKAISSLCEQGLLVKCYFSPTSVSLKSRLAGAKSKGETKKKEKKKNKDTVPAAAATE